MTFSDNALKWLKDPQNKNKNIEVGCVFLDALLARLEAAEAYIKTCRDYCDDIYHKTQAEAYKSWLEACGKSAGK